LEAVKRPDESPLADDLLRKFVLQRETAPAVREKFGATPSNPRKPAGPPLSAALTSWIEGGRAVAGQYASLRAEAAPLARARNALLERATAYYHAGKGAAAKQASLEGRELNERLHKIQEDAAKAIFSTRNTARSLRQGSIDLHGLHASEVDACLRAILPQLALAGVHEASVFTGSGHHSHNGGRLAPVVAAVAAELDVPLREIKDARGYTGGYSISLG